MTEIDNDYHPDDKGLEASQEDHWGTELKASEQYKGNNMISNMSSRSAYGAAQAQKRKEGKSPNLSTTE